MKKNNSKIQAISGRESPPFDAPDGFTWYEPRSFFVLVLVPTKGWTIRENETNSILYLTQQTNLNYHPTGFTLSCSLGKSKDYVPKFLKAYPGVLQRHNKENISEWETKELRGNFVKHTITFEDSSTNNKIFAKCCIIRNDTTGTVYTVMFENEKSNWEESWNTFGEVMTNNLLLPSSL